MAAAAIAYGWRLFPLDYSTDCMNFCIRSTEFDIGLATPAMQTHILFSKARARRGERAPGMFSVWGHRHTHVDPPRRHWSAQHIQATKFCPRDRDIDQ